MFPPPQRGVNASIRVSARTQAVRYPTTSSVGTYNGVPPDTHKTTHLGKPLRVIAL